MAYGDRTEEVLYTDDISKGGGIKITKVSRDFGPYNHGPTFDPADFRPIMDKVIKEYKDRRALATRRQIGSLGEDVNKLITVVEDLIREVALLQVPVPRWYHKLMFWRK